MILSIAKGFCSMSDDIKLGCFVLTAITGLIAMFLNGWIGGMI